jgi:hypothetical protein
LLALRIGEFQECLERIRLSLFADGDRLAYSVSFATLICGASNLAAQWAWPTSLHDIVFAVFAPGFLLSLNCLGVKVCQFHYLSVSHPSMCMTDRKEVVR